MKSAKGGRPINQDSSSQTQAWSKEDRKAIAELFALLLEMELDQKNNIAKERTSEVTR